MVPNSPQPESNRLRHRDAHVRKAKHLTAWTAAGGLVMTGGLAALAQRSFSGQRRTVAPADTSAIDPSSDEVVDPGATEPTAITLPPDPVAPTTLVPVPVTTAPVLAPTVPVVVPAPVETVPAVTVPVETAPPSTAAPVQTVPVTAPPAPPTTQPKRRTHTHTHPAVVVTSGGS
ncbi:MAG: hypothetical protein JWN62_15 [Acidimicrobiales bacterium]|nr:hypothetical protein [Acidimicrobiales bacterium]